MKNEKVTVSAPTRVDLAGGTLDLWPIHQLLEKAVTVNFAISVSATVTVGISTEQDTFIIESVDQKFVKKLRYAEIAQDFSQGIFHVALKKLWSAKLPALSIKTHALSPAGAGLGGSSCLMVILIKALNEWLIKFGESPLPIATIHDHVRVAQDLEAELIRAPTGCQDYYGALSGGLNFITFPPGVVQIEKHKIPYKLSDGLVLCYSGVSRASAINNWEIFKRIFDGDLALLQKFRSLGALAAKCQQALVEGQGKIDDALAASKEEWELRKSLWPAIETEKTKAIDVAAKKAGAYFSRVCGAGGGGVMAVFGAPADRQDIVNACIQAGGQVLDAKAQDQGISFNW